MNQKPVRHRLHNGIDILLVPDESAVSMTLTVLVRVGSRYEKAETNGASHFIEHMMFKGTEKHPTSLSLSKELDRFGAEYNAYTGKDVTAYYIKIDAAQSKLAIELLHEMLFHSKFESAEIERERSVILEEINMYEDNPQAKMEDLLEAISFPNSTLGWPIAGLRDVIRVMSRERLLAHKDRYYIPSRVTITAAGKIDAHVLPLLEKTFGNVPRQNNKEDLSFKPFTYTQQKQWLNFFAKKTEQVQLGMTFPGFCYSDKRLPAARLLALILGGSMSSRLFIEVRERRGLCYSIHAGHSSLEDTGIFSIVAGLERARFSEAVDIISQELQKVVQHGVSSDELQRAKDHFRGKLMLYFEDSANQADWYGKQWVSQHKLKTPEERLREINHVTISQISAIAKELFQKKNMRVAIVGPFEDVKEIESAFGKNTRAIARKPKIR